MPGGQLKLRPIAGRLRVELEARHLSRWRRPGWGRLEQQQLVVLYQIYARIIGVRTKRGDLRRAGGVGEAAGRDAFKSHVISAAAHPFVDADQPIPGVFRLLAVNGDEKLCREEGLDVGIQWVYEDISGHSGDFHRVPRFQVLTRVEVLVIDDCIFFDV